MIFWICIALVAIGVIGAFIKGYDYHSSYHYSGQWTDGFAYAAIALLTVSAGSFLIFTVFALTLPSAGDERDAGTMQLRSIGTDSAISGRSYFLGGGYVDEKRTLNYIEEYPDGGMSVTNEWASESSIYEVEGEPHVKYTDHYYSNGWVIPWEYVEWRESTFSIPSGSVLENYSVTN